VFSLKIPSGQCISGYFAKLGYFSGFIKLVKVALPTIGWQSPFNKRAFFCL